MKATLIAAIMLGAIANEFDLDVYMDLCTFETDTDDDIIREELSKRSEFDKQHKKALLRLLIRPEAREGDQAWQRTRVIREAQQEIERRMAFDEKHPRIYKSAEEQQQAYAAVFNPVTVWEQYMRSGLRPFDPHERGPSAAT